MIASAQLKNKADNRGFVRGAGVSLVLIGLVGLAVPSAGVNPTMALLVFLFFIGGLLELAGGARSGTDNWWMVPVATGIVTLVAGFLLLGHVSDQLRLVYGRSIGLPSALLLTSYWLLARSVVQLVLAGLYRPTSILYWIVVCVSLAMAALLLIKLPTAILIEVLFGFRGDIRTLLLLVSGSTFLFSGSLMISGTLQSDADPQRSASRVAHG